MNLQIVVVVALALNACTTFLKPVQASPIAAPACKDIPSCGVAGVVIGTEIVGGVLYYVVKNAAGAVHKIRSKQQQIPAHRATEGNGHIRYPVGQEVITRGTVTNQEQCNQRARQLMESGLGEWMALPIERIDTDSQQSDESGRILTPEFTPLYICKVKRVR